MRKWDCSPPRDSATSSRSAEATVRFFNLEYPKPETFVPRFLRREIPERISYKGLEERRWIWAAALDFYAGSSVVAPRGWPRTVLRSAG